MARSDGRRRSAMRVAVGIATAVSLVMSGAAASVAADSVSAHAVVVSAAASPRLGVPLVIGEAIVGTQVTAEHGVAPLARFEPGHGLQYLQPLARYTYQWLADGNPIKGATLGSLDVRAEFAGKRLSFTVTAQVPNQEEVSTATSMETRKVTKPGLLITSRMPLRKDSARSRYRVDASGWAPGTRLRYQWTIDGRPVEGATGRVFEIPPLPYTSITLQVVVTATRPGYETAGFRVAPSSRSGLSGGRLIGARYATQIVSAKGPGTPAGQTTGVLDGFVHREGRAIAGATVGIRWTGRGSAFSTPVLVKKAKTDADGHVRVSGLEPGNYCISVAPVSGATQDGVSCISADIGTTARVYAGSESPFLVSMSKTATISGKVTDSRGRVVKGARVSAVLSEVGLDGLTHLRTVAAATANAQGFYRISGLSGSNGHHRLRITGPTSLTHQARWWRAKSSDSASDPVPIEPGDSVTRNAVLQVYLPIGIPTVSGTQRVGSKLIAKHPKTKGATYTYQWRANGKPIAGAKSSVVTLTKNQAGKRITVVVTGKRSGYAVTKRSSSATSPVR